MFDLRKKKIIQRYPVRVRNHSKIQGDYWIGEDNSRNFAYREKRTYNMEDELKRNIRKLGIFILIAAAVPLLSLPMPLLPDIIRKFAALILTICCPLSCILVLFFGSRVIFQLPYKKIFRTLIFIVWLPLCTLLCWSWTAFICLCIMSIHGHV